MTEIIAKHKPLNSKPIMISSPTSSLREKGRNNGRKRNLSSREREYSTSTCASQFQNNLQICDSSLHEQNDNISIGMNLSNDLESKVRIRRMRSRQLLIQKIESLARYLPWCAFIDKQKRICAKHAHNTHKSNAWKDNDSEKYDKNGRTDFDFWKTTCALLIIDISGFTKLSTLLDVEKLSFVINVYFRKILDQVE